MQKVIVTGGMGYIGSHTVIELIDSGFNPIIVDDLSNSQESVLSNLERITERSLTFEKVDLSIENDTQALFERYNDAVGVIHFAASKAVGESMLKPTDYYRNNLFSLINVLRGIKAQRIPNLIFSSSCTVYGEPDQLPVTEESPVKPAESPYGNTKQIGEEIIEADTRTRSEELSCISLRYFNPIGAHPSGEIGELPRGVPANLVPYITQTAAGLREIVNVFGGDYNTKDGTAIRDYIHIVDLADAHVIALKRLIANENKDCYEYFNLGTGKGHSVLEVIHSFERMSGQKLNYQIVDRRPGDIVSIYADTTKAVQELKWQPKYNLDDMTSTAWQWEKKLRNL